MQSVSEFWQRLVDVQLLGPQEAETLKRAAADSGVAQDIDAVARWLIVQKKITRYQATGCLTGAYTSFGWGEFILLEPIDAGIFQYQLRAKHIPTGQPVILLELNKRKLGEDGQLSGILQACGQLYSLEPDHFFAPREIILHEGVVRAIFDDPGGTPLASILAGGTRLSVSQAAAIAAPVAEGLAQLHASGLFHGGICPQTIWIPRKGAAQIVLMPPWLSAGPMRGALDASMAHYAAPELQATNQQTTSAADLYALGCTLFEMLCGQTPFSGNESIEHKMRRHAEEPIAPLGARGIPRQMDQIVRYLMAKDIQVRYGSGLTVNEALQPLIEAGDRPKQRAMSAALKNYLQIASTRRSAALDQWRSAWDVDRQPLPVASDQTPHSTNLNSDSHTSRRPSTPQSGAAEPSSEASQAARVITLAGDADASIPHAHSVKSSSRLSVVIGLSLLAAISIGLVMALLSDRARDNAFDPIVENGTSSKSPPTMVAGEDSSSPFGETTPLAVKPEETPDDGKSLWASPTEGKRPRLRYLAPGPQMVLMARLSRVGQGPWDAVLRGSGLKITDLNTDIQTTTGFSIDEIDRLDIGLYERGGRIETVQVVHLLKNYPLEQFLQRWQNDATQSYAGEAMYLKNNRCYYQPVGRHDVFSIGKRNDIEQIIDWLGEETTLDSQRVADTERGNTPLASLVRAADVDRDVNLFFNANFVRSSRDRLYAGPLQPLHGATSWCLGPGENIQAGLLSLHLDKTFFCELELFCSRDKRPRLVAEEIYERLQQAPALLNQHLLRQNISPYSQATLALVPDMLRALVRYTRHDEDQPQGMRAILHTHLPTTAAAHLALAGELLLWETTRPQAVDFPEEPFSLEERLARPTTLRFGRDNLLQAVTQLSQEIGLAIELKGTDLEQEGITQNQSFGINMEDKPAKEILVEILRLANPIKNAQLSSPEQKLVYIVKTGLPGQDPVLWITTRTAARQREDTIPGIFVDGK